MIAICATIQAACLTARTIFALRVPFELLRIEVHFTQIPQAVVLRLVVEVPALRMAALAASSNRKRANSVSELDDRHKAVTAGAIPFPGTGIWPCTERSQGT
jgi:hypothetical protein